MVTVVHIIVDALPYKSLNKTQTCSPSPQKAQTNYPLDNAVPSPDVLNPKPMSVASLVSSISGYLPVGIRDAAGLSPLISEAEGRASFLETLHCQILRSGLA